MPLNCRVFILVLWTLFCSVHSAAADGPAFNLELAPVPSELTPGVPATLTLKINGGGRVGAGGDAVIVRLDAPRSGVFFSTDFPAVEGTRLLELSLPVIDGEVSWRQAFPIRGEYRLTATFRSAANASAAQVFTFEIPEEPRKWMALSGLAGILFLLGVSAGRLFSHSRENDPKLGTAIIALVILCVSGTEPARALGDSSVQTMAALEVAPATVGKPARILWRLQSPRTEEMPVKLSLSIEHVEKNRTVFALENIPVEKDFSIGYQFTDGSEYRVRAVGVTAGKNRLVSERTVAVGAVAPPVWAKLSPIILFLNILLLGLLVGRYSKKPSA